MSSDIALSVRGLGKRFQIGVRQAHAGTLRDRLSSSARGFARRLSGRERPDGPTTDLWALKDVSFDVRRGEVIGLVGGNGAGKTTLLKVLSRITDPTEGEATIVGRVGTLLAVSTGFHPELTGRENVFLNGAILGMSRAEVTRKFDAIVEFSGVSTFIDTPVRFYSSGMYVRLAFAVAAHMEPEILFVDEVLAVGDAEFQKKCLGKMNDVSREGRTILFVSHNLEAIQRLCGRGLLLSHGRLVESGPIGEVISRYRASFSTDDSLGQFRAPTREGLGYARVEGIRLLHDGHATGRCPADEDLEFDIDLALADPARGSLRGLTLEVTVCSDQGEPLCSLMNVDDGGAELPDAPACTLRAVLAAPTFVPGRYRLNTFVGIPNLQQADEVRDAFEFEILPPNEPWRPYEITSAHGATCRRAAWSLAGDSRRFAAGIAPLTVGSRA